MIFIFILVTCILKFCLFKNILILEIIALLKNMYQNPFREI